MPLVPMRPLLEAAQTLGYAQGGFNVNAVAQAKAVIEIHEALGAPAILQGADLANGFMGGCVDFQHATLADKQTGARHIADAVRRFAEKAAIPIALHLDHGRDLDSVRAAIDAGYTSVMIDGSALPYTENVELTREVVRVAHARGVTVEGELGVLSGMEDHVYAERSSYTNPLQAIDFIRKTGIDCLAISYGTMHGAAKGAHVKLRKEIATAIHECLRQEGIFCALVSHGSSVVPPYLVDEINALGGDIRDAHGIPIAELLAAIPCGIRKINIDTDIRLSVTRSWRALFQDNPALQKSPAIGGVWAMMQASPAQFDPRAFMAPVMTAAMYGEYPDGDTALLMRTMEKGVQEAVGTLVVQFGSAGKARRIPRCSLEDMIAQYG